MRLTLIATALVTVALAIASVVMVGALHRVLLRNADDATYTRADQIATSLQSDGLAGVEQALLASGQNVAVIQIVDGSGRIRLTNDDRYNRPMSGPVPPGHRRAVHAARASDSDEEFQATALGVATRDGPLTVQVGAAEEPINRTVLLLGILCSIVFPFIVIGMALLTFVSVGRALRPVEGIRVRVDEISGGDLDERVPVPPTGDEISALARTMNEMLGRIETARRRQLQFVNDASHELNSPLTTLVGLLDLADVTAQPIDVATVSEVMLPDALRLQQMVADLLLLARADESGVPLRIDEVDLDEIVSAEILRLEAVTDLTVDARIVACRILGDGEKLARALRNIADNAARYADSVLTVVMERDDAAGTVSVVISDDGTGIADADKTRVTERFVRLDAVRHRDSGGSGLGLAIVSEIIGAHGGQVTVGDSGSGGAAIGFIVPMEPAIPDEDVP